MPDLPEIKFSSIRAHLGSQTKGFEELVTQIFRLDTQNQGTYCRVEGAGGDGGVEAYVVRPDGSKIGVQSKFFEKVKATQWKQIEKSVHAALANHPELTEYRIAVPIDRNKTQIDTWNAKVFSWNRHAASLGITNPVKFVWQGNSDLIGELIKPACAQAQSYWFGTEQFSADWMDRVFQLALKNLDRRYSPAEHVHTEAGRELQAFAHSPIVAEQLKRQFLQVLNAWNELQATVSKSAFEFNRSQLDKLNEAAAAFKGMSWPERSLPSLRDAALAATAMREAWLPIHVAVENESEKAREAEPRTIFSGYRQGPHDDLLHYSGKLFRQVDDWHRLTTKFRSADFNRVLVSGDAGNGKSHVLAAIVAEARERGQPALLLLGEQFTEQTPLAAQIATATDWDSNPETLLSALNQSAIAFGAPALLFVDAINETTVQNLWFTKTEALLSKLTDYPHVRLALSCRSDFLQITLPEPIVQQRDLSWAYVVHEGLGESVFAAVRKYFERFNVKALHFPPPLPEFGNPLFLRLFCETFENTQIPDGPLSFSAVMKMRVDRLAMKLSHEIDCPEDKTRDAVLALARAIQDNGGKSILRRAAQTIVEGYSPSKQLSKSLYQHLKSNSIIVETLPRLFESNEMGEVNVRFGFERFADYSIAIELLRSVPKLDKLKQSLGPKGKLAWLAQAEGYYKNRGVARALTIAIPERFGVELANLIPRSEFIHTVLEDFVQSIVWRGASSFNAATHRLFDRALKEIGKSAFEMLLLTAPLPGHPYNALYLHERLAGLAMPDRELGWTIPLTRLAEPYHGRPSQVLRWAFLVPLDLISDEQARLAGHLLFWFFSSNFRGLRYRATLAAIRILQGRSAIVADLLSAFREVDDPYVQERMYAVASGVAMRERNVTALKVLTTTVFRQVFKPREINPHILLRDYARSVLEVAEHRGVLPDGVSRNDFKLPLRSRWPRIISDAAFRQMVTAKEWGGILHSTQPNTRSMTYGDFGRYTMQYAVQLFSRIRLNKPFKADDQHSFFDAELAQRWTLQRASELGWTAERFGGYDRNCRSGRGGASDAYKIERIGKKYQWIALHELLGYLSDHFHMSRRWKSDSPRHFEGAWQLSMRDFDPSQPLVDFDDNDENGEDPAKGLKMVSIDGFPDPFGDIPLNANREAWVVKRPDSFDGIIEGQRLSSEPASEWLLLCGYYEWTEPEFQTFQLSAQGQLKMWAHIRSWLVKKTDLARFLKEVRQIHFWGHGLRLISDSSSWIGEYPWGPQFKTIESSCAEDGDFLNETDVPHAYTVCGLGSSDRLIAPSPQLYRLMGLQWSGTAADFIDADGVLQVTQLDRATGFDNRPCIVRKAALLEALDRQGYAIVWGVLGERDCYSYKFETHSVPKDAQFSGVYEIKKDRVVGKITQHLVMTIPRDF